MANAHEATRHDMEEKTTLEFVDLERHDPHAIVVGVVLPAKSDAAVAVIDESMIGECDAVGVATERGEDLLNTARAVPETGGLPDKSLQPATRRRRKPRLRRQDD